MPPEVVPRAEAAFADVLGQRVVAEEMAQPHDRVVDRGGVGALADEDQIGIGEGEDPPVDLLDQELEGIDRNANVMAAPVTRPQLRQMDMEGAPPGAKFGQALNEFVERLLLARHLFVIRAMQH